MRGPIARATLRTTGVLFLRLLIQAGALLLLARLLGPADYGALAGATALATMLGMLSTFGTQWMLLAEVAREPARSREMLATALGTTTAIGGVLFAIYASAAHLLFGTLGLVPTLVAIGIAETVVQPLLVVVSAQQQALGHIATSQIVTTAPLSLRLAVIAGLWAAAPERPLAAYAVGYLCAGLAALAAAAWSGRRDWPRLGEWRCARPGELRAATGYAVLGLTSAAPAELDKTLAARLLAPVQAGIYAATARIVMAAVLPIAALMFAATPRLFREQERAGRLVRAILLVSAGYGLALAAFLMLAAPVLAPFFGA
ncbi:MAG TPA: oligosaccharide flippase family protein, partial [Rudaea sp.]|nr:oligosaccharide flippase family protein [Rudaea sp.]